MTLRRRAVWYALLALCMVHLALAAIEILHRPVFPWDAWLNWMYRAKAWYLSGGVSDMDPIALWASGQEPRARYAVAGHYYPTFLPLMGYGVAKSLGFWSETLVNLPAIACCIALAAGSYLIARRHGYAPLISAICAYMVLSVPLIGAHLSLAGQADIWMTATTGLGFALLCSALIHQRLGATAGGLLLVAVGTQFKVEGMVWLLAAVLLAAIGLRPKFTAVVVLGTAATIAAFFAVGVNHLDLPVLGTLGVQEGRLHVPLMGSYALQQYKLGDDYLDNFLLGGSWNLLWYLVIAAGFVSLVRARSERPARIALAFFVVATAAQVLIFFFTEQGAWADDWTAINRLPLHFVPALTLVSLLVLWPPERIGDERVAARVGGVMFLGVITILTLAGGSLALMQLNPDNAAVARSGTAMRAVVGAGRAEDGVQWISRFDNNVALLSTGPVSVDTQTASIARIVTRGSNRSELTLWWRSASDSSLYAREVAGTGTFYVDLGNSSDWRGRVTEIGLVFYDDGGSAALESLSLHAPGATLWLRKVLADWLWVAPWSQRSVHWLTMGNPDAALPASLALVVVFAVVAGAAAVLLPTEQRVSAGAAAFLVVWVLYDLSWLHQRSVLAGRTTQSYRPANSEALAFGDDAIGRRAVRRALCDVVDDWITPAVQPEALPRLLIAGNSDRDMRFQILRAKYHALPVAAYPHEGDFASLPANLADRVLVLKLRYGQESSTLVSSEEAARLLGSARGKEVRLAWEDEHAYLLVVDENVPSAACWQQST